jgi:hypothetical protein
MDDRFFDPVILYRQGCLGESHANAFFGCSKALIYVEYKGLDLIKICILANRKPTFNS